VKDLNFKELVMKDKKYYNNQECTIIGVVDGSVIIEVDRPQTVYNFDGPPHTEINVARLIVPENMVTDHKITPDTAMLECENMLKNAGQKAKDIINDAKKKAENILTYSENELKYLHKKISKYYWAIDYINFVEGNYTNR
jgi:hypothetical protein